MPAPSPAAIVADPEPLNPFTAFPLRVDPFPGEVLTLLAQAIPLAADGTASSTPAANPARFE